LRCKNLYGTYDASLHISKETLPLYIAFHSVTGKKFNEDRPFIYNDDEQILHVIIKIIVKDIKNEEGKIREAIE
jgi:hypothetical protein